MMSKTNMPMYEPTVKSKYSFSHPMCLHVSRSRATAHTSKRIHKSRRQHARWERKVPKAKSIERAISHPCRCVSWKCARDGVFCVLANLASSAWLENENSEQMRFYCARGQKCCVHASQKISLKNGVGGAHVVHHAQPAWVWVMTPLARRTLLDAQTNKLISLIS